MTTAFGFNFGGSQYGYTEKFHSINGLRLDLLKKQETVCSMETSYSKFYHLRTSKNLWEARLGLKFKYNNKIIFSSNNCDNPETDVNECELASTQMHQMGCFWIWCWRRTEVF